MSVVGLLLTVYGVSASVCFAFAVMIIIAMGAEKREDAAKIAILGILPFLGSMAAILILLLGGMEYVAHLFTKE